MNSISSPATRFVASFLGGVNWMEGAGIRPEAMRISKEQPPGNGARAYPGVVENSTFLGNCLQVQAKLSNGTACVVEVRNGVEPFRCWGRRARVVAPD